MGRVSPRLKRHHLDPLYLGVNGRQREDSASSSREERLGEHNFYLNVEVVVELRLDLGPRWIQ